MERRVIGNYHARCGAGEKPEVEIPEAHLSLLGKIPEFPQKISTCRKYNISTTIVLQSIAQIKMLYKDDYETIIGNCDTAICLGTNEQTTADYFSKKLGKATITSKSKSTQVGKSGGSMSFNQTGRELMTPDEIMTMPFDECIVMMNHISPFYDKKYPLEKHPQFQYTGDADKKNFYYLENDPEFIVADNTQLYNNEAIMDSLAPNDRDDKFEPMSMAEILKKDGLLKNNPDEDNYMLVQDVSKTSTDSMIQKEYKNILQSAADCIRQKYKTIYYNGEYIDPVIITPMITRLMNQSEEIADVIVSYYDMSGKYKKIKAAIKNDSDNAAKIIEKMGLKCKMIQGPMITIYEIDDIINEDMLEEIKTACMKGYETIVSSHDILAEEDTPMGYDGIF